MAFIKKLIVLSITFITAALVGMGILRLIDKASYDKISFTVNDTLPDGQGKKARVILLGGQSNASGCSRNDYLEANVSNEKYSEYENGYDNVYINYLSGANQSEGFVKCSVMQGELVGGFGPELGIADKLHEMYPDETLFIIKCAWGGTNLYEQWLSPTSRGTTGELYKKFVKFVECSMDYLISKNYDAKIEAMCWMQGESDSIKEHNATRYENNLTNFIKDIRNEFECYASDDGIAFVDAYIEDIIFWSYYETINEAKQNVADSCSMNVAIDTIAEGLTTANEPEEAVDLAHYDALSEIKLGHLFAENAAKFFD